MTDRNDQPQSTVLSFSQPSEVEGKVIGESKANIVASELICGGIPFSCRPAPGDRYTFFVEPSSGHFLKTIIKQVMESS